MGKNIKRVFFSRQSAAIALNALNGMISANIFIYITALFLSSYPPEWIPYFLLGQTILVVFISYFIAPSLAKYPIRSALFLEIACVITIIGMMFLMQTKWFYFPLIFSFILTGAKIISTLITSNNTRNAFDLIEMKEIGPLCALSSVIGKIIFSVFNVFLIKKFGIQYLPYCIVTTMFASCFYTYTLTPLPAIVSIRKPVQTPFHYPLFRNLLFFSFCIAFCYTLIDYMFRHQLTNSYNAEKIGEFISIFTAITYILSIIVTFIFSKKLILSGIANLLVILPCYWMITAVGVVFHPGIVAIALMSAGEYFLFNYIKIGRTLLINVFPNELRPVGEAWIQTAAESIGIGAASLSLIVLAHYISLPRIALCLIAGSFFLLLFSRRIHKNYVATLKSEILLKRFIIDEHDITPYQALIEKNIHQFLASANPNSILFGYSLIFSSNSLHFPAVIVEHLHHSDVEVRIVAIRAIIHLKAYAAIDALQDMLEIEKETKVRWWIVNAFGELCPTQFIDQAKKWLTDPTPEMQLGGIRILFSSKQERDGEDAFLLLIDMLKNANETIRQLASHTLIHIPTQKIRQILPNYICSIGNQMNADDIRAIALTKEETFLPLVIDRLLKGGVFYAAREYINQLGDNAIPLLMKFIYQHKNNPRARSDLLISILGQMPTEKAENALMALAQYSEMHIRQMTAHESLYRATHFRLSNLFRAEALQFSLREAELIQQLRFLGQLQTEPHIVREITARIYLASRRYLDWLGVYFASPEIHGLIPTLLYGNKLDKATAMELLTTLISDQKLIGVTTDIFHNVNTEQYKRIVPSSIDHSDTWISEVMQTPISHQLGTSMNTIQKIFILRQVTLFKDLPAETLMVIADETSTLSISAKQIIFSENDSPTDFYIIVSGKVHIIRQATLLAELGENNFFGELALIDSAPRTASAIAQSEGMLLVLNKEVFERITNDLPQVLRSVAKTVLIYLRANLTTK